MVGGTVRCGEPPPVLLALFIVIPVVAAIVFIGFQRAEVDDPVTPRRAASWNREILTVGMTRIRQRIWMRMRWDL